MFPLGDTIENVINYGNHDKAYTARYSMYRQLQEK